MSFVRQTHSNETFDQNESFSDGLLETLSNNISYGNMSKHDLYIERQALSNKDFNHPAVQALILNNTNVRMISPYVDLNPDEDHFFTVEVQLDRYDPKFISDFKEIDLGSRKINLKFVIDDETLQRELEYFDRFEEIFTTQTASATYSEWSRQNPGKR